MKRAIRQPTRIERIYQDNARDLGCVVCLYRLLAALQLDYAGYTQLHHRNVGDKHGAPQLGQHAVVAMCSWHHAGDVIDGRTVADMRREFGPSFHHHAREFRNWTRDVLGEGSTAAWQRYQDDRLRFRGLPGLEEE